MKNKILFIAFLLLVFSCGNDDSEDNVSIPEVSTEDGRRMQVSDLYDFQIKVNQTAHLALLDGLVSASHDFSSNPTEVELLALQNAWKTSFLNWKSNEVFNLGIIQSSFIHTRINQWPINFEAIEENILVEETLDNDFVSSKGANTKGYNAIEYLLFHDTSNIVLIELTTANNAEKRMQYLLALIENLNEQSIILKEFWGEVEPSFKSNLETGVNGSQNQVVNAIIAGLESMKGTKIEEALNAESDGVTYFEAYRSEISKEALIENLETLNNSYLGDYIGEEGFGLDDYLIEVLDRPDIDIAIQEAFQVALNDLYDINGPIEDTLVSDIETLDNLRVDLQTIIGLLKTDFSSAANIVVTFNDTDGD
ncbi:imelysin family protein [uncultured Maribacter sp.]|uniref:imelysin family protein n=1 Tax=uncultured Maribacter sp. TaxID=431308 RepID=UPI0026289ED0|nr:imelysin family protein [uncultured Maribacter sp.]